MKMSLLPADRRNIWHPSCLVQWHRRGPFLQWITSLPPRFKSRRLLLPLLILHRRRHRRHHQCPAVVVFQNLRLHLLIICLGHLRRRPRLLRLRLFLVQEPQPHLRHPLLFLVLVLSALLRHLHHFRIQRLPEVRLLHPLQCLHLLAQLQLILDRCWVRLRKAKACAMLRRTIVVRVRWLAGFWIKQWGGFRGI